MSRIDKTIITTQSKTNLVLGVVFFVPILKAIRVDRWEMTTIYVGMANVSTL